MSDEITSSSSAAMSPKDTLESLLGHLGFVFEIEEQQRGSTLTLNVLTRDPRRLIGRDGHILDDLQYLVNRLLAGDEESGDGVRVDVENYRQKETESFLEKVKSLAEQVEKTGEPETLPPMNSYDRYLIHQAFKDHPKIRTKSVEAGGRLKSLRLELRPQST